MHHQSTIFFGHGIFSADGSLMFTTENDYEVAAGRIGIWDTRNGYHRVGEIGSGGIGPHDIKYISEQEILVVANGGALKPTQKAAGQN
ncbi:MAG: DUF1513 domain-containing protein [Rhodobacteraceae bacterium]|nr:DUF1513 domain-containing protein [Paracoccaceae bacterium]